jgi:hypothetical protein
MMQLAATQASISQRSLPPEHYRQGESA